MKVKQSISVKGQGERCPKCNNIMQRREHRYLTERQKRQPFYFSEWDVCVTYPCRYTQHYEQYKTWNNNDMSIFMKAREEEKELLDAMKLF